MTRLVVLGPPGAGKGTQAARLAEHLGVPTVSTGQIFRDNIAARTTMGRAAQAYIDAGHLVPDEVTDAMVRARLAAADVAEGFLLDGYPRTVDQARTLDALLAETGLALDGALEITADADEVVRRLLHRASIEGRADDTEDVIRERLRVYAERTAPVSTYYRERGMLVEVDGRGDMDEVTRRMLGALERVS